MLRVGELAEQTGVSVKTLRFYEEAGVLTPRGRTSAGYRLYTASAVERVRLVRGAQLAGLSLAEIADVCAALDDRSSHDAAHRLDEAQPRIDAALALLTEGSPEVVEATRQPSVRVESAADGRTRRTPRSGWPENGRVACPQRAAATGRIRP